MTELENKKNINVIRVEPLGFGNPESKISYAKQVANGELTPEAIARAEAFIESQEGLVPIETQDDGCIDGRKAIAITHLDENGEPIAKPIGQSNLERAKVAGGGYITGQAMRLGVGVKGESIEGDLLTIGTDLAEKNVFCGAHTGAHQHGEGTDCGANDRMAEILANGLAQNDEGEPLLKGATQLLIETAGLEFKEETFTRVLGNWQATLEDEGYFGESTGLSRLKAIIATQDAANETRDPEDRVGVTKHLRGDHKEDYIIVNYIAGTTFSQAALLEHLHEENDDEEKDANQAQAFVVDAWRIVELAQSAVDESDVETAIYAGVMYQLATAGTLTDGTLPIYAYTESN